MLLCYCIFIVAFTLVQTQPTSTPSSCSSGYGGDCSCSSDFNGFLQQLGSSPTAVCSKHQWSYVGNVNIGNEAWNIQQDTVSIFGQLIFTSSSSLTVSLSPGDDSNSGLIIVSSLFTLGAANVYFNFLTAPVGSWNIPFIDFGSKDTSAFIANLPTLPSGYTICRQFPSNPQLIYNATTDTANLDFVLQNNPQFSCTDGRGPLEWTVVLMILLSIHAVCLLLFCLITCKKESLKQKIWEVEA